MWAGFNKTETRYKCVCQRNVQDQQTWFQNRPKNHALGTTSLSWVLIQNQNGNAPIEIQEYCQVLADFFPYADASCKEGWIFQQDGTTPHTSAKPESWFSENNIQFLQRPPSSADLYPIANVWQILKNEFGKRKLKIISGCIEQLPEIQHCGPLIYL